MKTKSTQPAAFSKSTIDFLQTAGNQKSESWLDKKKDQHEEVLVEPLKDLALFLGSKLSGGVETRGYKFPKRGFGRLRRPSHKIEPGQPAYRDWVHLSASRPSTSRFDDNPGLYFYASPERIFSGGGLYAPSSRQIKKLRAVFANDISEFEDLFKDRAFKKEFPRGFESDKKLKTFPRDYPNDHENIEWLRLQAFYVKRDYTKKEFYSKNFRDLVLENWRQCLRVNELLEQALAVDLWDLGAGRGRSAEADDESPIEIDEPEDTTTDLWDDRL